MSCHADKEIGRREFLEHSAKSLAALPLAGHALDLLGPEAPSQIIDDHQHTNYGEGFKFPPPPGRTNEALLAHQRAMGVRKTILLPSGSDYILGLQIGGNDSVVEMARQHPNEFAYFANEDPRLDGAQKTLEKYLKGGAIGIGEQKFPVACDSPAIQMVAEVAQEFGVPVLMHFEEDDGSSLYANMHLERFHKILERFPKVIFLGHAQTWWANIDGNYKPGIQYPKGPVAPGGLSERLLSDYPNMVGDISAGSGLNALTRDEGHAREFLKKFQDKLTFGSDCSDTLGHGPNCIGWNIIQAIRRLAPEPAIAEKLLHGNTERIHYGKI